MGMVMVGLRAANDLYEFGYFLGVSGSGRPPSTPTMTPATYANQNHQRPVHSTMTGECKYCDSTDTVPVLDASMRHQPGGGNPYRVRCRSCWRWLPSTSKAEFKNHLHPRVLPKGVGADEPDSTIPLEEWDRSDEFEEVVQRVLEDGGSVNEFDCPACGAELTGYPDECSKCETPFEW